MGRLQTETEKLTRLRQWTRQLRWSGTRCIMGGAPLRSIVRPLHEKKRRAIFIVSLVAVVALGLMLPLLQVCRDWGFIDQNTGARKGYREWLFGLRTGVWYQETALEAFIRTKHPGELRQQWISYAGTGRNVFGAATLYGHGQPGPIIQLRPEMINTFCGQVSESEKKGLYDALASGNPEKVRGAVDRVIDTVLNQKEQKTEPNGSANRSQPIRPDVYRAPVAAGSGG